jgi:hypothetical protein
MIWRLCDRCATGAIWLSLEMGQNNKMDKRDMLNQVIQRHPIFSQTDSMDIYIDYM